MKQLLFYTDNNFISLILRLTVGVIMFTHGAQKLLGLYGGYGFKNTMTFFTETMKLPYLIALLVILIEFFGAILLVFGLAGRVWAALFIVIMLGAIYTTNFSNGFFMNWFGNQDGEGYEYHLLVIGICIAIIIGGSGKYSIDRLLIN